jgi:hypothetical protein
VHECCQVQAAPALKDRERTTQGSYYAVVQPSTATIAKRSCSAAAITIAARNSKQQHATASSSKQLSELRRAAADAVAAQAVLPAAETAPASMDSRQSHRWCQLTDWQHPRGSLWRVAGGSGQCSDWCSAGSCHTSISSIEDSKVIPLPVGLATCQGPEPKAATCCSDPGSFQSGKKKK